MITKSLLTTDHELLSEIRSQSRAGAETLYDRYARVLLLAILRDIPDRKTAHDILCQTYIVSWGYIQTHSDEDISLLELMMCVAREETAGHFKTNKVLKNIHLS